MADGIALSAYTQAGSNTAKERKDATATVEAHALYPADARRLLYVLGLLAPPRTRRQMREAAP